MKIQLRLLLSAYLVLLGLAANAQEDEENIYEKMLREEVKVENPVYKPVVGIGFGMLNFYGDVHSNVRNPFVGTPGYKINIATFIDKKHYFRTNFSILLGSLVANQSSLSDSVHNRNFKTDITCFGLNIHYSFDNLIKENKNKVKINPFISIGIEDIQYNSKTDLLDANGNYYHYWSDGTIHQYDENYVGTNPVLKRDYTYETDLREKNQGSYSQNAFAIPIDLGIDFTITDRLNLRIGQSLHYTFTKNIDNMNWRTGHPNKMNDMFTYSYISLHFDLFSDDKTILVQKLFAEVDNFDYAMYGDEDNDGVYDIFDKCPATPFGVAVDSLGCPYDKDNDGVPDYKDKEPNSRPGAMVDEDGVEMQPGTLAEKTNVEAINRKEVEAFLLMHKAQNRYKGKPSMPLPAKFKSVDTDGDGYISFDELLKAIDDYFDFSSTLSSKEIYELQDFFFDQ